MNSRIVVTFAACSAAIASAGWFTDFNTAPHPDHGLSGDLVANPLGGGNPDVIVWDLQS